jgi:hypothetical protein
MPEFWRIVIVYGVFLFGVGVLLVWLTRSALSGLRKLRRK